ncbi:MAG TPA: ATP-binding cassette domain-containing protein [Solirubrobacter sp.]|nr:ATP-binding cassette domain-containing protein [Solirubrobacter sp.]
MLELRDICAWHGPVEAVRGVSLTVPDGSVLAVVGANGAGKSTLARAVAGLHRSRRGVVRTQARDLSSCSAVEIARAGVALVPQGRRLFGSLTVDEHLAVTLRHRRERAMAVDELLELFPQLRERRTVRAKSLSGGEQQMLAIARAVLLGPDVVVMDEPTEGLAPAVVELVGALVARLREDDVSVLLLEQRGAFPLAVADEVLEMDRGVIARQEAVA